MTTSYDDLFTLLNEHRNDPTAEDGIELCAIIFDKISELKKLAHKKYGSEFHAHSEVRLRVDSLDGSDDDTYSKTSPTTINVYSSGPNTPTHDGIEESLIEEEQQHLRVKLEGLRLSKRLSSQDVSDISSEKEPPTPKIT